MSEIKTPETAEVTSLIKGRIQDEFRKHPDLDWAEISAGKLYYQWSEFFGTTLQSELTSVKAELDNALKTLRGVDSELVSVKAECNKMREALENIKKAFEIIGTNNSLVSLCNEAFATKP